MKLNLLKKIKLSLLLGSVTLLYGCNAFDRISEIGSAPTLSAIEDPTKKDGYQPIQLPMPSETYAESEANSLWRSGSRAFFRDQRANKVGDILTVVVAMNDKAIMKNKTTRGRTNSENSNFKNFLGADKFINSVTNDGIATNFGSTSGSEGNGQIDRSEVVDVRMAALVTQILPNGNFTIQGKQQVRVNFEMRELSVSGVVRPEDIDNTNEVPLDKIAEARISVGGRGALSDFQQPRYGQQLYDIIFPF